MWRVTSICECGESLTIETEEFSMGLVCPEDWTAFGRAWRYTSVYCPGCSQQLQWIGEQCQKERGFLGKIRRLWETNDKALP